MQCSNIFQAVQSFLISLEKEAMFLAALFWGFFCSFVCNSTQKFERITMKFNRGVQGCVIKN